MTEATQSLLPVTPELCERIATSICRTVAEIPDRSSPDDWPEAMLVTADELNTIVVCALENEAESQSHSLPGDVGKDAVRCDHEAYQGQCCHCGVPIVNGRALSANPAQPVDEAERLRFKALRAAEQFIVNGIEMGYITMPDASTPDSAHETLPLIRAALTPSPCPGDVGTGEIHVAGNGQVLRVSDVEAVAERLNDDPAEASADAIRLLRFLAALTPSALSGDAGEEIAERVALAIRDVSQGEGFDYMDFCRDAARAVLVAITPALRPLRDIVGISSDVESKRVLCLHFNREATGVDRAAILAAVNLAPRAALPSHQGAE